jgi:cysteine desulfurase
MPKRIYLDYAASTPVDKKVLEAMLPYLKKEWGNPSSTHWYGQRARAAIELARESAANFLNADPLEVFFTSGATESNNAAILGTIGKHKNPHIITSQIEHESILALCEQLERDKKAKVTYVPVSRQGLVRIKELEEAMNEHTVLVSIQLANSEIGTIQSIAEISRAIKAYRGKDVKNRIVFHTDAVQGANYLDCNVEQLGVDALTLSSHKIYGPKGVGLLYQKKGVNLSPLLMGGGQEYNMRGGTENVAGIVGFGQALKELQNPRLPVTNVKVKHMKDRLVRGVLRRIPDSKLTGVPDNGGRLINNAHFRFKGADGKDIVMLLDQRGIAISAGSACSEKSSEVSRVLLALGLSLKEAASGVRITVGKQTNPDEIDRAIKGLVQSVHYARSSKNSSD